MVRAIQIFTLLLFRGIVTGFIIPTGRHGTIPMAMRPWMSNNNYFGGPGDEEQTVEVLQSLIDFHEGRWSGRARSFTVVPDIAAGILQRKESPSYEVSVKLGVNSNRDYTMTETLSWDEGKFRARTSTLTDCNMDVDSVDASYSMDYSMPDLPSEIIGTESKCQFGIEHCIATSEDQRMRCVILYNMEQSLERIVVCDEQRITDDSGGGTKKPQQGISNQLTAQDLLEMQEDTDRLVDKITGNMPSDTTTSSPIIPPTSPADSLIQTLGQKIASNDGAPKLSLHDVSLLEVSSGVWLGDAIIRDNPSVLNSPSSRGQGFGSSIASSSLKSKSSSKNEFAAWSIGVQKVAWRWMWNFGDEIRQVVNAGKAIGEPVSECLTKSLPGNVCVNESLSRRMAKKDRMVYIDWATTMVGILVGPTLIHAPRYLSFDSKGSSVNPSFYTEFAVFQSTDADSGNSPPGTIPTLADIDNDNATFPKLCFSRISRTYNYEGRLKQGCTSFYTFKRFGVDDIE